VRLGVLFPYTGEASALSANLEKGALLAAHDMNRAGGVGGLPVEIIFGNSFSDGERSLDEVQAMLDSGVVAVVGADDVTESVFARLTAAGVPLFSPLASTSAEDMGTAESPWFRMAPSTRGLGDNLAKVVGDMGTTRIAAVIASDPYHVQLGAAFIDRVSDYATLEMLATLDEAAPDYERMTRELSEHLDAGTEGVMLAMHPRSAARLATELAVRRAPEAPPQWYLTPRLETDVLLQNASPGALDGAIGIAPEVFDQTRAEFEERFLRDYDDVPFDPTFYVYDATAVTLIALDRALSNGHRLPAGIAAAIDEVASFGGRLVHWNELALARQLNFDRQDIQYTGLTGPVILANDGSRVIGTFSTWRVEEDQILDH
jgi:branched-chain amino acid transport system substrate-binding protein